jgi:hypothetical protein
VAALGMSNVQMAASNSLQRFANAGRRIILEA